VHPLAERLTKRDFRALARAITWVENDHPESLQLLQDVFPRTGGTYCLGITGSPGAGKSSLVNRLIDLLRSKKLTVAVVAVDPTSPFSGGAILGDRVRMANHFTDPNVFIRSMGTRGSLGGLSRTTKDAVRLLDAFGFDVILIETVGVGQSELDIMKIADSTAVVLTPGAGDVVQVFKAGIMEIADLFIINKADQPGVGQLNGQINSMLNLIQDNRKWRPPILRTSASKNEGLDDLWTACLEHQGWLHTSGEGIDRRKRRHKQEILEIVQAELLRELSEKLETVEQTVIAIPDPYKAAEEVLKGWKR
jgi:LAO/AO transport system kinase